jgi:hypothetical protein
MATLKFAGIEDRTMKIGVELLGVPGRPPGGQLPLVQGRWHRFRFVPLLFERSDTRFSWVSAGLEADGFARRKLRNAFCLRPDQLGSSRPAEMAVPDRIRARKSGIKGPQNVPVCATFLGSLARPVFGAYSRPHPSAFICHDAIDEACQARER